MINKDKKVALTGGYAVGEAITQINPDVMAVYPITPQTPIVAYFSKKKADGKADTEIIQVESEHSAMSACIGASASGARTITASASQGIMYMMEVLPVASAMRLPIVMAVANRAISGPLNIHCDHSDAMAMRDTGWIQIFSESAQEAYDNTFIALKLAEKVLLPATVNLDGFILSHSVENLEILGEGKVGQFVGEYKPKQSLLDFENPKTFGAIAMPNSYFEFRKQIYDAMETARNEFDKVAEEFGKISGRKYEKIEAYKMEDAETVLVAMGSTCGTIASVVDQLREEGKKVGLLKIRLFRPFPYKKVKKVLKGVKRVAVMDRNMAFGTGQVLAGEIQKATGKEPESVVYGLGGRDIYEKDIRNIFEAEKPLGDPYFLMEKMTKEQKVTSMGTCAGCPIGLVARTVLGATDNPVAVTNATGCMEVTTTIYPNTSWKVPYIHSVFANAGATVSGMEAAYKALSKNGKLKEKKPVKFVAFGGDGGTYDIGLQALSGALERGHDFLYVCYDNGAYMNTGNQRSGATPYGSSTETTPAGKESFGKEVGRKDLMSIVAAHHIKYAATANVAFIDDFKAKAKRALETEGPTFLLVFSPCPNQWKHAAHLTIEIGKLGTETNFWPLYEIVNGEYKINYRPKQKVKIEEFMKPQGRFKHIFKREDSAKLIKEIQERVDLNWERVEDLEETGVRV